MNDLGWMLASLAALSLLVALRCYLVRRRRLRQHRQAIMRRLRELKLPREGP